MGEVSPGGQTSLKEIYISHTGTQKITNCKIYIIPYSAGVYLGARTAQDDYDLIISWGDSSYPATSGEGLYINMNHSGGFPASDWQVFRTGGGDTLANAFQLPATAISSGVGSAGEIPAAGEAHIKYRVDIDAGYAGTTGLIYTDTVMYYESTS
jgi:hypothetical protein